MGNGVAEILDKQLKAQGSDWALPEDSVRCVQRIVADTSIHGILFPPHVVLSLTNFQGRGFGIVPRSLAESGYVDLAEDDYRPGTLCHDLQKVILKVSHRK
jgi:hypothetical protein